MADEFDPQAALAALAAMDRRRRQSVRALLWINLTLALGLAAFFIGPELRCEPDLPADPPLPPDPRTLPFTPTSELTLVDNFKTVTGINYQGAGFFIAPRSDGSGWFYFNLVENWTVDPAYLQRLERVLTKLPVTEPEGHHYTPVEVVIRVEGRDPVILNLEQLTPDMQLTWMRTGGRGYLIRADDARVLYPTGEAVRGQDSVQLFRDKPPP